MQSNLKKYQLYEHATPEEFNDLATKAYHQKNLAFVPLNEITDPYFKQELINFCDRKYGKRQC